MMSNSVKLNDIYATGRTYNKSAIVGKPSGRLSDERQGHIFADLMRKLEYPRQYMEDCFADKTDIRFQFSTDKKIQELMSQHHPLDEMTDNALRIPPMNIVMNVRDITGRRWTIIPTMHAWEQIIHQLGIGKQFFQILGEYNSHLLNENLNFMLDRLSSCKFLLRLVSLEEIPVSSNDQADPSRPFVLRAFLPDNFSRMDNVYILNAIRKGLSKIPQEVGDISYSLNSNDMMVDIGFAETRKLTKINEEYMSGVRVRASEIGRYRYILVMIILKRLVCNNGMTMSAEGEEIHIPYFSRKISLDRSPNKPPYPTSRGQSKNMDAIIIEIEKIMKSVENSIGNVVKQHEKSIKEYAKNANKFINSFPVKDDLFASDDDIRAAVILAFSRMGIAAIGGAKSEDVVTHFKDEKNDWNIRYHNDKIDIEPHLGWIFLNAITRYAAHQIISNNLYLAQNIQSAVIEKLLNPRVITWPNIAEEIRAKRKQREKDAVTPPQSTI